MPQFDKVTFFNQIFWVTLVFFTFYFVLLKQVLPALFLSLKTRKKAIKSYGDNFSGTGEFSTSLEKSPFKG